MMDNGNRILDRITVILHRPAIPENIGAVARAMKNTGFPHLIISCPETDDWSIARKLAVKGSSLLENAPICNSLNKAITRSGARFLVGTSGRNRKYWKAKGINGTEPIILQRAISHGVALLFGPENTGLTNEELSLCNLVVNIPSSGGLSSFNLSHAVIIVLYQIMTAGRPEQSEQKEFASFENLEGMYGHLQELLLEVNFLWKDNPDHIMRLIRGFFSRASPTEVEVKVMRGIFRRLIHRVRRTPGNV